MTFAIMCITIAAPKRVDHTPNHFDDSAFYANLVAALPVVYLRRVTS